jgi:hypothetical protein
MARSKHGNFIVHCQSAVLDEKPREVRASDIPLIQSMVRFLQEHEDMHEVSCVYESGTMPVTTFTVYPRAMRAEVVNRTARRA